MPIPSSRDTIYLHRGDDGKVRIGVTRDGKTTYWNGEVVARLLRDAREYALGGGAIDPDPTITAAELAAHGEYTRQLRRDRDYEVTKRERAEKEASYQAERAEHFRRRLLELEPRVDWANRLREERDQLIAGTHPISRIERHRTLVDVGADHYMIVVGCTCGLRFTTEDEAVRHQAAVAPKEP